MQQPAKIRLPARTRGMYSTSSLIKPGLVDIRFKADAVITKISIIMIYEGRDGN